MGRGAWTTVTVFEGHGLSEVKKVGTTLLIRDGDARLLSPSGGDSGGVRTSLAIVARCVVFLQKTDRKTLSPRGRFCLFGGEAGAYGEPANVRQMLLKFILGLAFH